MNSMELARAMVIVVALAAMSITWMAHATSQANPLNRIDGNAVTANYYLANPNASDAQMPTGNESQINIQLLAHPGNYTIYAASLLNSSGWLDGYAIYALTPHGAALMAKAINVEPGQRYLLVVYEVNSTSTYLGYEWLPSGEALRLINDAAWTRAVALLPLSDYARGGVEVRVMLPSGPAGNGTVCAIPPMEVIPIPYIEGLSLPTQQCSYVSNGVAIIDGIPLIPYVVTYSYSINVDQLLGVSGINESSTYNETIHALGTNVNVTVRKIVYYEASPGVIEAIGRGLFVPGQTVEINASIIEYPSPLPPYVPAMVAEHVAQYETPTRTMNETRAALPAPREYFNYGYAAAMVLMAIAVGAAAAIAVGRRVNSINGGSQA